MMIHKKYYFSYPALLAAGIALSLTRDLCFSLSVLYRRFGIGISGARFATRYIYSQPWFTFEQKNNVKSTYLIIRFPRLYASNKPLHAVHTALC
ncbi:MAG: hypothetical protein LBL18_06585 [Bacteroidales bacterium]|nr:hypothetical protein [Bacteroidales bacterium]